MSRRLFTGAIARASLAAALLTSATCGIRDTDVRLNASPDIRVNADFDVSATVVGEPEPMHPASPPPEDYEETVAEPPGGDYMWIDGYWHWNGAQWVWVEGGWVEQRPGYVYVDPHYERHGAKSVYVQGHWRAANEPGGVRVRDHRDQRRPQPGEEVVPSERGR